MLHCTIRGRSSQRGSPTTPTTFLQSNPVFAPWLRAAEHFAAPWGGLWSGELARQQFAAMSEFNQQAMRAWMGAWAFGQAAANAPAAATPEAAPQPEQPVAVPAVAAVEEVVAVTAEAASAATDDAASEREPTTPRAAARRGKPAAQLRAAPMRRTARQAKATKPKGVTRH